LKKFFPFPSLFLFSLFAFLGASCLTQEAPPEAPAFNEALLKRLDDALEREDYRLVLQDTDRVFRDIELSPEGSEAVESRAALAEERLRANLQTALEAGDYPAALIYLRELQALGEAEGEDPGELLFKMADAAEEDRRVPALLTFQSYLLGGGDPGEEDLRRYGGYAMEEGQRYLLELIVSRLREGSLEVPESFEAYLDRKPGMGDYLSGTVTIWVNRGYRIERGMGYADRVIGSGFFIDRRGYLLTNYHVIESQVSTEYKGYSRLYVRLPGDRGDRIPAEVVGWDPVFDLALLKTVMPVPFVFSFDVNQRFDVGERVYAIGSPGGLENTVTSGIVSARGRSLLEMGEAIQVDAPLNGGNSGGPLLNAEGGLLGVVFAKIPQFEGINFAIPTDWIAGRIPEFYQGGRQTALWLGLSLYDGDGRLEVIYVFPNSPAEMAGIRRGDVLTEFNGRPASRIREAQRILLELRGQRLVRGGFIREGETFYALLNLDARPDIPVKTIFRHAPMAGLFAPLFGMQVEAAGRRSYVVKRVFPGSPADEGGFSENDPFVVSRWELVEDAEAVILQMRIKKRKAGFIESVIQLAAWIKLSNVI
jgi:S1-C subfamily serine protease